MQPDAGDLVWAEFGPVLGTEQSGRRPALVLSPAEYNVRARRSIVCPVSTVRGDWPWNVPLPADLKTRGVVLVDQVRAIHTESRVFGFLERAPPALMAEVRTRLARLVGMRLPPSDIA